MLWAVWGYWFGFSIALYVVASSDHFDSYSPATLTAVTFLWPCVALLYGIEAVEAK